MAERVGKELSVHRIQNLLSPDRILHTTQRLVYQRLQNANLLAACDFPRRPFLERKVAAGEKLGIEKRAGLAVNKTFSVLAPTLALAQRSSDAVT
jgi:hypothetical protein